MIRWLLNRQLDRAEKELGVPVDEARYIAQHSVKALLTYGSLAKISEYRGPLAPEVYYAAKIAAHREQDCGTCLQISVNQALRDGVPKGLILNLVNGEIAALSRDLREVYRFATEQANRIDNPELRERLRERYGDQGLITLAFAITSAATFPTVKRVLGYAVSCSRAEIVA